MAKILIIAQAPPLKSQTRPMDSTLFETWLKDAGYQFDNLEDVFEFEAVYDKFPGKTRYGAHRAPSKKQRDEHWPVLETKILAAEKIWVMGNTAYDYVIDKILPLRKDFIWTMHPSRRNLHKYRQQKDEIIKLIKHLLS